MTNTVPISPDPITCGKRRFTTTVRSTISEPHSSRVASLSVRSVRLAPDAGSVGERAQRHAHEAGGHSNRSASAQRPHHRTSIRMLVEPSAATARALIYKLYEQP